MIKVGDRTKEYVENIKEGELTLDKYNELVLKISVGKEYDEELKQEDFDKIKGFLIGDIGNVIVGTYKVGYVYYEGFKGSVEIDHEIGKINVKLPAHSEEEDKMDLRILRNCRNLEEIVNLLGLNENEIYKYIGFDSVEEMFITLKKLEIKW